MQSLLFTIVLIVILIFFGIFLVEDVSTDTIPTQMQQLNNKGN